jgi:hypothetical protein
MKLPLHRSALPFVVAALAACAGTEQASVTTTAGAPTDAARQASTVTDSAGGTVATPAATATTALPTPIAPPRGPSIATFTTGDSAAPVVKGLYVNRFAAQSSRRMRQLIAMADSTEVNALVIDMKDEFGLNFVSRDADLNRNAGDPDKGRSATCVRSPTRCARTGSCRSRASSSSRIPGRLRPTRTT